MRPFQADDLPTVRPSFRTAGSGGPAPIGVDSSLVTIFLVRHGSAGRRNDSDAADIDRRLDPTGRAQADAIATLLGDEAVTRVVSSPAARCVETVLPLATELGVEVDIADDLVEDTPIERCWAVAAALASSGVDAVLCSHGDVIPDIVRRAQTRGMVVAGPTGCSKGSVWTLHWNGEHFDRGSYQRPDSTQCR